MKRETLTEFADLIAVLQKQSDYKIDKVKTDIYRIVPSKVAGTKKLAFLALTHGDEIAGLHILNAFLKRLIENKTVLQNELYLIVANRDAYLIGERYVSKDLNRQYGIEKKDSTIHEEKRVHDIRDILDLCDVSIDLHQTIDDTLYPFFIFPYKEETYQFARKIAPEMLLITMQLPDTIPTSSCYMASKGKIGITLEVGAQGVDIYQVTLGVHTLEEGLREINHPIKLNVSHKKAPLYTLSHLEPYKSGILLFRDGLKNFDYLKQGEAVCKVDGKDIVTPQPGYVIRYPQKWFQNNHYQPDGMFYLAKQIDETEMRSWGIGIIQT
jgi:succinylglutamate desuccinylase